MRYQTLAILALLAAPLGGVLAAQQTPAAHAPHTIVIKLVERAGAMPFAFDPLTFSAERGDTLKFVQATETMHNVHFKAVPAGAHLGNEVEGPYLTTVGQTYVVVVDSRFVDGKYELVCDPHEMIGMHAFLTVNGSAVVTASR